MGDGLRVTAGGMEAGGSEREGKVTSYLCRGWSFVSLETLGVGGERSGRVHPS